MVELRETVKEFNAMISHANELKKRIITFRESFPARSFKQTKTLQLLESAADHIADNLERLKQRVLTDLKEE